MPDSNITRDRGILSEADREFLIANEEERKRDFSQRGRYKRKEAVRDRTRNAIRDFSILLDELEPKEVAEILDVTHGNEDTEGVYQGMVDGLALFFISFFDRDVSDRGAHEMVDMLVRRGIERALESRDQQLDSYQPVRFNEQPSVEELRRRFFTGEKLNFEEFQRLQAEGGTVDLRDDVEISHFAANRENTEIKIDGERAEEYFEDELDEEDGP